MFFFQYVYHSCTICGKPILSGGNFKTHMKNIHGIRDLPNPKLDQTAVTVISVEKDLTTLKDQVNVKSVW